jgi:hypothetical protein
MRRRWRSYCRTLALAALALFVPLPLATGAAHAADDEAPSGELWVTQIGSQVLVVDQAGNLYDYPTTAPAPSCEGGEACWGFSPEGAAAVVIIDGGGEAIGVDAASGPVLEVVP